MATKKDGTMAKGAKKKGASSLIPGADDYLDAGMNVLLISQHGVGKTASIMELAKKRGLKLKYYSCATLDPYTDLVGVPVPRNYCVECRVHVSDNKCSECGNLTIETLKMVRPREVDEAEIIFLDEFNRAQPAALNAVFEMIQFKSINGEPLPNLKCVWAAINPPDTEDGYQVENIDPALLDRFDVYLNLVAKPSARYMQEQGMPGPIAYALKQWWDTHAMKVRQNSTAQDASRDYISPRRLEKIGQVWMATQNQRAVKCALPLGAHVDSSKLIDLLQIAQKKVDGGQTQVLIDEIDPDENEVTWEPDKFGGRPNPEFIYKTKNLELEAEKVAAWLRENQMAIATHQEIIKAYQQGIGGVKLIGNHAEILDALNPQELEAMFSSTSFPAAKQEHCMETFAKNYANDPATWGEYKNLHRVLNDLPGASLVEDWPASI